MSHDEYRDLCAAHALNSLDPADSIRLLTHLQEGCDICEAEIEGHGATVEALGRLLEEKTPPAEAEERLMARVAGEEPREGSRLAARKPRSSAGGMFTRWLLPAAALVVAGFALFIANQSSHRVTTLSAENETLHEMIDRLPVASVRKFELGGTEASPNAHAWAYVDFNNPEDPTDDKWAVHVDNLPPAPEGKIYQAWIETGGKSYDLGTLRPDVHGHGYTNRTVPGVAGEFTVRVTLEDDKGAPTPSGPVILRNSQMSFTHRPPPKPILPQKTNPPDQKP